MMNWAVAKMKKLGIQTELRDVGMETLPDGTKIPLPPVIFGTLGNSSDKKTVLLYGHLDVQPAAIEDGWDTSPFVLTEKVCWTLLSKDIYQYTNINHIYL